MSISTSKATKTAGKFQIHLVPRKNYLNFVYPNDVVNIYVDSGDGRGFVRVMFGYVDRVFRQRVTDNAGATRTIFAIIGSDFQKAVEQTYIYFNPHFRVAIDPKFKNDPAGNLSTIAKSGIVANGTPADIVENIMTMLLGFGRQWVTPESYVRDSEYVKNSRKVRVQRTRRRLPETLNVELAKFGLDLDFLGTNNNLVNLFKAVGSSLGGAVSADVLRTRLLLQEDPTLRTLADLADDELKSLASVIGGSYFLDVFRGVLFNSSASFPATLLDLLDFSCIEYLCIDGFLGGDSVWQGLAGGGITIAGFLNGHVNSQVNELIYDLRPVSVGDVPNSGPYSTEPDELGINVSGAEGFPASTSGVKYVPSVVLREYPYSTVEGIDLGRELFGRDLAFIPFGPVFSKDPNSPGRKVYDYTDVGYPQGITPAAMTPDARPMKYLDVVVVAEEEIKDDDIGRSDDEVMNLFALYAVDSAHMEEAYKFTLADYLPILTRISAERMGLRSKEDRTPFAATGIDQLNKEKNVNDDQLREDLVRWSIMLDHWYQHNHEYLSGTITLGGGRADIRVGYRLDIPSRRESYYVDQVSHNWEYPGIMTTIVQVSRGQRNDPYLSYVSPEWVDANSKIREGSGNRGEGSRLGQYFKVVDGKEIVHKTGVEPNTLDMPPNEAGGITIFSPPYDNSRMLQRADNISGNINGPPPPPNEDSNTPPPEAIILTTEGFVRPDEE